MDHQPNPARLWVAAAEVRGARAISRERGVAAPAPRLFAALPLPESLRREFFAASGAIARLLPTAVFRRVPPENLHLTLRFFGPERGLVERGRIAALLRERIETHCAGPLTLKAGEVSAFGSLRRARIVWVGLSERKVPEDAPGRLVSLQRQVEAVARELGLPPETRPFLPHVTLGRLRAPSRLSARDLSAARPPEPDAAWWAAFTAREFGLFASFLRPGGAVYERLDRFPLSGR